MSRCVASCLIPPGGDLKRCQREPHRDGPHRFVSARDAEGSWIEVTWSGVEHVPDRVVEVVGVDRRLFGGDS